MGIGAQFCRECGCRFPPRRGEGRCRSWWRCWLIWTLRRASKPATPLSEIDADCYSLGDEEVLRLRDECDKLLEDRRRLVEAAYKLSLGLHEYEAEGLTIPANLDDAWEELTALLAELEPKEAENQ